MSSIIASSRPPASVSTPVTSRGVLSKRASPIAWASRRAGSMVRTTTRRPCSAARSPRAAAAVVLPTPPAPQQTTMRVLGSAISASTSSAVLLRRCRPLDVGALAVMRGPRGVGRCSCHALLAELLGEPVQRAEVDAGGDGGQLVDRPAQRLHLHPLPLLQRQPRRVLPGLVEQPLDHGRCRIQARGRQALGHLVGVQPALAGRTEPARGKYRLAGEIYHHP